MRCTTKNMILLGLSWFVSNCLGPGLRDLLRTQAVGLIDG